MILLSNVGLYTKIDIIYIEFMICRPICTKIDFIYTEFVIFLSICRSIYENRHYIYRVRDVQAYVYEKRLTYVMYTPIYTKRDLHTRKVTNKWPKIYVTR